MNQKHHKDWWPLSKQTVICFLVIPHSCYRRFVYNLGSQKLYKKYWCWLITVPVPFEWRHRPLLESCGNGTWLTFPSLLTAIASTDTKEKSQSTAAEWLCQFHLHKEITFDSQWRSKKVPWYCCRKLSYLSHRWSKTAMSADVSIAPQLHTEKPQCICKQACTLSLYEQVHCMNKS